jgi:hypothetical protein
MSLGSSTADYSNPLEISYSSLLRAPDWLLLPFAFFSVGFVGKVGAVSRARDFCAAKRTLDTPPTFHSMSLESEGKKTLKS